MLPLTLETTDYEQFRVRAEGGGIVYEFAGAAAAGRAFPGDEVRLAADGVELVKRSQAKLFLVGTLELNSKSRYGITSRGVLRYKFLPYDLNYPPFFVGCSSKDTTQNLLVRIQFDDWPASSTCPIGVLVQTFGPAGDLEVEEAALLAQGSSPVRWRREDIPSILSLSGGLPPLEPSSVAYTDSTDLCTFHVDPPGCRDIDDAISFKQVAEGAILVKIHIADVASWLKAYPLLTGPAAAAGQTLYRDGVAVRPMFPAELSEGAMSLLPGELRRAWTLNFLWSGGGEGGERHGNPWWTHDEIRVKESYTYESVLASPHADLLGGIASTLAGRPLTDPHEWIEHMMLFYNRSAAEELKRRGVGVLRRHAAPDLSQLEAMRRLGLPAERLAMRAGEYCLAAEEDTVHWGLGAAVYCHASSPIRRWADCVNQMALSAVLHNYLAAQASPFQVVEGLNAAARRAKRYERDLDYVRALLGPAARESHAGTVVEPGRIWVPYLERIVRADTGEREAGEEVRVRFFTDAGKRNWKQRLVLQVCTPAREN